jgi:hypothetical protein
MVHDVADDAVAVDAMHRDVAWVVVGGQQKLPDAIDADLNWPGRKRLRLVVRLQGSGGRIDAERICDVFIASDARPARNPNML